MKAKVNILAIAPFLHFFTLQLASAWGSSYKFTTRVYCQFMGGGKRVPLPAYDFACILVWLPDHVNDRDLWSGNETLCTHAYKIGKRRPSNGQQLQIVVNGFSVADLVGKAVMYFCVHNCTSPSNDYTAVVCSNNN